MKCKLPRERDFWRQLCKNKSHINGVWAKRKVCLSIEKKSIGTGQFSSDQDFCCSKDFFLNTLYQREWKISFSINQNTKHKKFRSWVTWLVTCQTLGLPNTYKLMCARELSIDRRMGNFLFNVLDYGKKIFGTYSLLWFWYFFISLSH